MPHACSQFLTMAIAAMLLHGCGDRRFADSAISIRVGDSIPVVLLSRRRWRLSWSSVVPFC
ncbi:MAG: hypothetical protein ABIP09_04390 [Gemmatimonadaceae bacterium]